MNALNPYQTISGPNRKIENDSSIDSRVSRLGQSIGIKIRMIRSVVFEKSSLFFLLHPTLLRHSLYTSWGCLPDFISGIFFTRLIRNRLIEIRFLQNVKIEFAYLHLFQRVSISFPINRLPSSLAFCLGQSIKFESKFNIPSLFDFFVNQFGAKFRRLAYFSLHCKGSGRDG